MGDSGFSVFEFHFWDSDSDGTKRRESDRRRPTAAERRKRRSARQSGDGGGSKVKTGLTVVGALSVVGGLVAGAWYLLRGRGGDGDTSGRAGGRNAGTSDRAGGRGDRSGRPSREVTVVGGSAVRSLRSDGGTASLVGLAFLLTATAIVRRYVADDSAAELADRVEGADEVTVLATDEGSE